MIRFISQITFFMIIFFLLPSCDSDNEIKEYTKKKESKPRGVGMSEEEPNFHERMQREDWASLFTWTAPESWKKVDKPSRIRLVTYEIQGSGGIAECIVSALAGDGGGVLNNVNMWRQQMSLPPIESMAFQEMQKIQIAGFESIQIDLQGTYKEKELASNLENFQLLEVMIPIPQATNPKVTFFIRMVGPQSTIAENVDNFKKFCQSFTLTRK